MLPRRARFTSSWSGPVAQLRARSRRSLASRVRGSFGSWLFAASLSAALSIVCACCGRRVPDAGLARDRPRSAGWAGRSRATRSSPATSVVSAGVRDQRGRNMSDRGRPQRAQGIGSLALMRHREARDPGPRRRRRRRTPGRPGRTGTPVASRRVPVRRRLIGAGCRGGEGERQRQGARDAVAEAGLGVDGQRGLADRWPGPQDEHGEQEQGDDRQGERDEGARSKGTIRAIVHRIASATSRAARTRHARRTERRNHRRRRNGARADRIARIVGIDRRTGRTDRVARHQPRASRAGRWSAVGGGASRNRADHVAASGACGGPAAAAGSAAGSRRRRSPRPSNGAHRAGRGAPQAGPTAGAERRGRAPAWHASARVGETRLTDSSTRMIERTSQAGRAARPVGVPDDPAIVLDVESHDGRLGPRRRPHGPVGRDDRPVGHDHRAVRQHLRPGPAAGDSRQLPPTAADLLARRRRSGRLAHDRRDDRAGPAVARAGRAQTSRSATNGLNQRRASGASVGRLDAYRRAVRPSSARRRQEDVHERRPRPSSPGRPRRSRSWPPSVRLSSAEKKRPTQPRPMTVDEQDDVATNEVVGPDAAEDEDQGRQRDRREDEQEDPGERAESLPSTIESDEIGVVTSRSRVWCSRSLADRAGRDAGARTRIMQRLEHQQPGEDAPADRRRRRRSRRRTPRSGRAAPR